MPVLPTAKIIIPLLNPIKWHRIDPVDISKYVSTHMDDHSYLRTIKPWEQVREYGQPWQLSDTINQQFESSFLTNTMSLCDQDGDEIYTEELDSIRDNVDDPNLKVYQPSWNFPDIAEGVYFLKMVCYGDVALADYSVTLISEPLIFLAKHKNSLLLEYTHYQFKDDVIFETGFSPSIRIRGTLRLKPLSSKDSFFEDQVLSMQTLDSKPYRLWEFLIGGASGIPDWLADRVGRILGCSSLLIDGKAYQRASENARLEEKGVANYPMRSYSIELREAENLFSKTFTGDEGEIAPPTPTIADNVKSKFIVYNIGLGAWQHDDLKNRSIIEITRSGNPVHWITSGTPALGEMLYTAADGTFTPSALEPASVDEEIFVIYK
jgi:hypothetical protein